MYKTFEYKFFNIMIINYINTNTIFNNGRQCGRET